MDDVTRQVRSFYERYPYPPGAMSVRPDTFPAVLLSSLAGRPQGRPIRVLDAGCGRGHSTIPMAVLNADVEIVAVDVNPVALEELRREVERRNLGNVRVVEADVADVEALEVPPSGYDLICSSGVLHHLADPPAALAAWADALAPDGVLALMVYGAHGRTGVERLRRAINVMTAADAGAEERLRVGRSLVHRLGDSPTLRPPWDDAASIHDVEFADRYLHPHAAAYSVPQLFELLARSGLRFLRWLEPADWDVRALLGFGPAAGPKESGGDAALRIALDGLDAYAEFELVELLFDRPALSLLACRAAAVERPAPAGDALLETTLEWNPQAELQVTTRRQATRVSERVEVRVGNRPPVRLDPIQAALARAYGGACDGRHLIARAFPDGGSESADALARLESLVALEVLFVP